MFECKIIQGVTSFYLTDAIGGHIPVKDWNNHISHYLSELSIINELLDNGSATAEELHIDVEFDILLRLDEIDKQILGLPRPYPFVVFIESEGIMSQSNFRFKYGFFDFAPNGNRLNLNRNGILLHSDTGDYLLSHKQYRIIEEIEKFNIRRDDDKSFHGNLSCFSEIKGLSDDVATMLDGFLKNQNVLHLDRISLDFSFREDTLELKPRIETQSDEGFQKAFSLHPVVKPVYSVRDDSGGTTRVIFDNKQFKQLEEVKKKSRIRSRKDIDDIVENPEKYFDDETIDLSLFSKRVREIGLYKPKFYPFICPFKSEWIPGFIVKDKILGEKKVYFKSQEELDEFKDSVQKAKRDGKLDFTFKDETITVEDGEGFITVAEQQLKEKSKPLTRESSGKKEVLIIKENAELLEYTENTSEPEKQKITFKKINNLSEGIELKIHQMEGIAWLQSLYQSGLKGCLLADDMGLGKTLQLLYFLEWHAQNTSEQKPHLIVAPVSLLENWELEYKRFFKTQNLDLKLLYGSHSLDREFSSSAVKELQKKQIILTSYESVRNHQLTLCAVDYSIIVLDEAQKIKTPGTLVTNVSKALKADFKVAMSGTPVENTLLDLWCIMDFSVPGLLGNAKEFAKTYQKSLKDGNTDIAEHGEKLRESIGHFLLRRLKKDVAKDLPNKHLRILKRAMPAEQYIRYAMEIELANRSKTEVEDKRNHVLKFIWAIRDISDHPYILDNQIHLFESNQLIKSSAKLQVTIEILEEIKGRGEKVMIFADKKATQKMLQKVIGDFFEVTPPSIINGDTPSTRQNENGNRLSRQQTINRFQSVSGFNVIIMSQLAAGVGLNVVEANHVIHYSRHWNPAKEEQATDRAYRIGQKKDVHVYYPMAVFPEQNTNDEGKKHRSFDEVLDSLLKRKQSLASSTLFPTEQAEVRPEEIFDDVFESMNRETETTPLELNEIQKLNQPLFEAFVSALYTRMGYETQLTPSECDKGADVIALGIDQNILLLVQAAGRPVGTEAVEEVLNARNYYETKYNLNFQCVVFTNTSIDNAGIEFAQKQKVGLVDIKTITEYLQKHPISMKELLNHQETKS
jgi:SNF2 family DNA or RNA helicase/HJR/Mrr/RecB family endonuclease